MCAYYLYVGIFYNLGGVPPKQFCTNFCQCPSGFTMPEIVFMLRRWNLKPLKVQWIHIYDAVQLQSGLLLVATPWTAALQASLPFTVSTECIYHGSVGKSSACNAEDLGSTPGLGRSPGEGNGNPLQCSCLENPHGQRSLAGYTPRGRKSQTRLSN